MPISPIAPDPITRFYAVGVTRIIFCATLIDPSAPTSVELSAGTDLTPDWADWSGWSVSTEFIDMPGLQDRFVSQLPGRISAEASSISFYADSGGADLRELMPRDSHGYVVIADGGITTPNVADIFEVQVAAVSKLRSADDAAKIKFDYAILSEPNEDVVLPVV